ncbi:hypothetical protein B6G00_04150 [Salinivibrio sp. YCSC6]|nr:hypothetical protein B6G00_04150 [Salinivibrio sp. YCSC6]
MKIFINLLRNIIFYPMLWLRGIFVGLGRLISGLCLIVAVISLFFERLETAMTIWMVVASFGFFMFNMIYDSILLKLNPTGHILILD